MSAVRIPPVLREAVGGARELPAAGGTVGEVLESLFEGQPLLADRLRPDGTLSSFVNVYVNGDDIRHRDGLGTPVGEGDVVILLPAMAGGSVRLADRGDRATIESGPRSSVDRAAAF